MNSGVFNIDVESYEAFAQLDEKTAMSSGIQAQPVHEAPAAKSAPAVEDKEEALPPAANMDGINILAIDDLDEDDVETVTTNEISSDITELFGTDSGASDNK